MKAALMLFATLFVIGGAIMAGFVVAADEPPSIEDTWRVEGTMSDACQCVVFCPCEFLSTPTFGHCDDAAILHIRKGHYGRLDLEGLRVAVVSESPEGERLVDTVGDLKFARIYVDESASDEQTEALAFVARSVFGAFMTNAPRISPNESVHRVPMEVTIEPLRHKATIPGILELDLQALTGGDGKTPIVIRNSPFAEAGFGDVLVARSTLYTYRNDDVGVNWDYGGRSASIRDFTLSGMTDAAMGADGDAHGAVDVDKSSRKHQHLYAAGETGCCSVE